MHQHIVFLLLSRRNSWNLMNKRHRESAEQNGMSIEVGQDCSNGLPLVHGP